MCPAQLTRGRSHILYLLVDLDKPQSKGTETNHYNTAQLSQRRGLVMLARRHTGASTSYSWAVPMYTQNRGIGDKACGLGAL